ncbi:competence protein CoiA [Fredinandcohnia quinoae]|uniref:Competence protein CoiA n=1 Tax=Fredinandcohnia quinoae TaxID=2918902 RepID=A0AAW5EBS8_9BACI|nr:competence protein CoiA family protein [Fredinandcohnia sp. SECRCQ15]MCH1626229.1 hypothetical protein [Fredinandcohnia sp. SECRCQ15]
MLVALRKNGEYISLLDKWKREELQFLRRSEVFLCPACEEGVLLKIGTKKINHFAHKKGAECAIKTESESEYHLQGKKQLYHWFVSQGLNVEIEPYLKEILQRPDLLVIFKKQKYAIEFQCSQIEYKLFQKRTDMYKRLGIVPIWILGAKWLKRKSSNTISLSQFQWLFASNFSKSKAANILYYCPQTSEFLKASSLSPFTISEVFCSIQFLKEKNSTFKELLCEQSFDKDLFTSWANKKRKWRITFSSYPNPYLSRFLTELYKARIPPAYLPVEAGLPVPSMYWIQTPPMIWQMWLLLDLIIPCNYGDIITYTKAMSAFSKRISSKDIQLRQLPLINSTHHSFAIMEYLQILTNFQILERMDKTSFKKIKEIFIPTSLQEAYDSDEQVLKKFAGESS